MSYKIHPNFFRSYFYQKKKIIHKTNFHIILSKNNLYEIVTLNKCNLFRKYLKSLYRVFFRKIPSYILNFSFFNANDNFIITFFPLFCIKGPELVKIRKRKPKRKKQKRKKKDKEGEKRLFQYNTIIKAIEILFPRKNIWLKHKFCKLGPLMETTFEETQNIARLYLKKIDEATIEKQHRIFYSLKYFLNNNFFQEAFCIFNAVSLSSETDIVILIDYIRYYFKKNRKHHLFYKFLTVLIYRYNNLTGSRKENIILQIKGRFVKNKRAKKRRTRRLEEYALSKFEKDCLFSQGFAVTKSGCFGIRLWVKSSERTNVKLANIDNFEEII